MSLGLALAGGAAIAAAPVLVTVFGRDPHANEHDLSDYHAPTRSDWEEIEAHQRRWREHYKQPTPLADILPAVSVELVDILPPAPEGMNAGSPLYAGMLFDTWYPESPAEVAARVLREIGEKARAKAGIRPAYATADRDMTGAFPVVRAA